MEDTDKTVFYITLIESIYLRNKIYNEIRQDLN